MACRLCEERGKHWEGSDPKCAFNESGIFTNENWNCATMNQLRIFAEELNSFSRDDLACGSIGYVPMDNEYSPPSYDGFSGYVVMTWYKDRGKIDNALVMTGETSAPLTIELAEIAIRTHRKEEVDPSEWWEKEKKKKTSTS